MSIPSKDDPKYQEWVDRTAAAARKAVDWRDEQQKLQASGRPIDPDLERYLDTRDESFTRQGVDFLTDVPDQAAPLIVKAYDDELEGAPVIGEAFKEAAADRE